MAEIQFNAEDTVKLQFRCERPGSSTSIEVATTLTAADLGLTGRDDEDAPVVLTAQFDSDAVAEAMIRAATLTDQKERLAALAEVAEMEAAYRQQQLACQR